MKSNGVILPTLLAALTLAASVPRAEAQPATPVLVRDIFPGLSSSAPGGGVSMNGILYFRAFDAAAGSELWRTDGTAAGTVRISNIGPGSASSNPHSLTVVGNRLFFLASPVGTAFTDRVYSTDGTPGSVFEVSSTTDNDNLVAQGNAVFFRGCAAATGCELWSAPAGQVSVATLVKDLIPGSVSSNPRELVAFDGRLFFAAEAASSSTQLWASDGTADGTVIMAQSASGAEFFTPIGLTVSGPRLFFWAYTVDHGFELFATEGDDATTEMVAEIRPGATSGTSTLDKMAASGGKVFFLAKAPDGAEVLFASDGTAAGTVMIPQFQGVSSPYTNMAADLNGVALLSLDAELWRSDGTVAGTYKVKQVNPSGASAIYALFVHAGVAYFSANDGVHGAELWRSDGTDDGTTLLAEIRPGAASSTPFIAGVTGNRLFFQANDGVTGIELWSLEVNRAPVAVAGPDLELAEGGTGVVDGSESTDPDSDPLTYEWRDEGDTVLGTEAILNVDLANGVHDLRLTVSDGQATASDTVRVTIGNSRPIDVTVASFEAGEGSVGIDEPPGVCNATAGSSMTCTADAAFEAVVTLIATPSGLSVFNGWSGACSGSLPTCTVTMSSAKNVTATFRGPQILTLEAVSFENGVGEASASNQLGISLSCQAVPGTTSTCAMPVRIGDSISFVALPGPMSVLTSIAGCVSDPVDPNGAACGPPFTMTGPRTISATFRGPQTLTLEAVSFENGVGEAFASNQLGISLSCQAVPGTTSTCAMPVRIGDSISFVALPGPMSVLTSIAGCVSDPVDPNGAACGPPFTMTGPRTISATFRGPQILTLEAVSFENGVGEASASNQLGISLSCQAVPGTTSTCAMPVRIGDSISFVALPGPMSVLTSIAGCVSDPVDPNGAACGPPFTMTGPRTISATFRGPQTLTLEAVSFENGVGEASASNQLGISLSCPAIAGTTSTCTFPVRVGDWISFVALPGPMSVLNSIGGCVMGPLDPSGAGCYPFAMSGPKTVSATFGRLKTLLLDLRSLESGQGIISMSPQTTEGGCGVVPPAQFANCARAFPAGTILTLTASPSAAGSVFEGWTGACAANGTNPTCEVVLSSDTSVGGTFHGPQSVTVTFGGTGAGSVNACPSTSGPCVLSLPIGMSELWAFPSPSSDFQSWGGACAGQGATCQVNLTDDLAVQANFKLKNRRPTAVIGGPYAAGRNVPIAFTAAGSSDPDGDPISYHWDFGDGYTSTLVAPMHAYLTNGVFNVSLMVSDGLLNSVTVTSTATITNTAPVAVVGGPYTAYRNQPKVFDGSGSFDPNGDALTYAWMFGPGQGGGAGVTPLKTFATTGTFTVTLTVNDGSASSAISQTTVLVRPTNLPPTANPGGPYTGALGQPVTFNGSASFDPYGDPLVYAWNFGDGTTGTGVSPSHSYASSGVFTVTLRVNDGFYTTPFVATTAAISNGTPTANAGGSYAGARGQTIAFTGTGTDPDGDSLTYRWDFGDGSVATGPTASHAYATLGTFTATLTTTDGVATSAPSTATVVVGNRAPEVSLGGPYSGVRQEPISFTAAGSDADGDSISYSWVFGDGATGVGPSVTHSYATAGAYTVSVTANDGIDNSAPASAGVTISNRPPTASAGGPYSGPRNTAIAFSGAASSDPDGDPLTYLWEFGDGTTDTGVSPAHSYAATGTFTATLIVNDGAADSPAVTSTVTIFNQAPIANAGGPYASVRNQTITFSGAASSDPDSDPLTYVWDFGDGGTGTGVAPTHAYTAMGTFTATLTVNDGTTDSTPVTAVVTIANQAPTANAGGPYSGVRNQAITFSGAASSDPDSDPLTYAWDFGDGGTGTGVAPAHAYTAMGTFTVTLTVNDGTTNSTLATASVTISNRAAVANPGGPYAGTRVAAVAFSGALSSDPDGDPLTYAWTFGDGGTATGPTPTHLYAAVGTFTVTLTVDDGTTSSAPVTTSVQITNLPPTVSLTSPGSGSLFNAPAAVTVSATAGDPEGAVSKVEFFSGAVKIGQALTAPYSILWSGVPSGLYSLTAVVTDGSGATVSSTPVAITVNALPAVALTTPADNAQFAAPASITLTASASDADGAISQVEFFRGAVSLGVDTTSPYSVTWAGAASGSYTLTAVATDNRGAVVVSAPITVKVTAALAPAADSYVRASSGNSNFGTATTLTVQQGSSNSNIRWTYMKFDLANVPSITTAKVRLYGAVSATTSTTIQTAVYSVSNTTWTETGLTWNNKPASGTSALATTTIVNNSTTARWYEMDVTAYLQAEKAAGRNVVTLAFKNLANSTPYVSFTSKEGSAANRPQLLVIP